MAFSFCEPMGTSRSTEAHFPLAHTFVATGLDMRLPLRLVPCPIRLPRTCLPLPLFGLRSGGGAAHPHYLLICVQGEVRNDPRQRKCATIQGKVRNDVQGKVRNDPRQSAQRCTRQSAQRCLRERKCAKILKVKCAKVLKESVQRCECEKAALVHRPQGKDELTSLRCALSTSRRLLEEIALRTAQLAL